MKTIARDKSKVSEDDIYGSLENQIKVTKIYEEILVIRDKLIEEDASFQSEALTGPMYMLQQLFTRKL